MLIFCEVFFKSSENEVWESFDPILFLELRWGANLVVKSKDFQSA